MKPPPKTAHYKLLREAVGALCAEAIDAPIMLIRPSTPADLPAITAIYAEAVLHGTGTFELDVPDQAEMARRRDDVLAKGLPWLVAETTAGDSNANIGTVLGYAYANHFRPRRAYRFCLEDSIYLAPAARGLGVGSLLLAELMARCEAQGARQMLAVIGDAANQGSVRVHQRLGFTHTGVLKASGWKFGRWLDVVLMQRALGLGDTCDPVDAQSADNAGV
jgi:L-amino acid N-acyltransferase YncA